MKLLIGCANSDGLMGFDYSHDGYWNPNDDQLDIWKGSKTLLECANECLQDLQDCVAIFFKNHDECYHYSNISAHETRPDPGGVDPKAYIKCTGKNK